MFADPAKLMNGGQARNDRVILDHDVAGQTYGIRKNDVVAELAVVGDVGITKQEIVRADPRWQAFMSAAMHRGVFPEYIVVSDFQKRRLAQIFQILGFSADHGERKKLIAAPEFRVAFQNDMGVQDAIFSEFHVRTHHATGADPNIVSDSGEGRYDGGRMNHARIFGRSAAPDEKNFMPRKSATWLTGRTILIFNANLLH